ncbi:MAG: hypothetical protein ABI724_09660 [Betaproteobacteria bacterium]
MIFGMSLPTFTLFHVVLSLIGIATGLIVVLGMFGSKRMPGFTALFLASTLLTSVTGFFFPFTKLLPSHIVGIISVVVLIIALLALYANRLIGHSRWIYIASAVLALYLNSFVAVVQAFLKYPPLNELAPTQSEPPFVIAQAVVLAVYFILFIGAVRAFRPR